MPQLATVDIETLYDDTYSLSKLTTEAYVRDPRFELIGIGFKLHGDSRKVWAHGPDAARFIRSVDWSDLLVIGQNTAFDGLALAHHYGVKPAGWIDVMGMSRALFPHEKSHSLAAQLERTGLGEKGDEVLKAKGKRWADFTPDELRRYGHYCLNDVAKTEALFDRYMALGFPAQELKLIDLTLRMFIEPRLTLDKDLLTAHLADVRARKLALLERVRDNMLKGYTDPDAVAAVFAEGTDGIKKLLMSNDKFAQALQDLNVEPPTKISPTTGKTAWAFAKTDEAFKALAEHPNEDVQALVAARLGNKTTLEETRTETLIDYAGRGRFPVALRYYGAHTGRWCLTGDHEVLTPSGWVRLDVWAGEPIRQWCAADKAITWCTPKVSSFEVDEPVVEFSSKYHRAMYTKEHRLPIRKRHTADSVKDITAGRMTEMAKKELYVSGYAKAEGAAANPEQLRLIVAMHADGYNVQDSKNNMVRFRFTKARKVARLTALLQSLRIPYSAHVYPSEPGVTAVVVRGEDAPDWLRAAKVLPHSFYSLGAAEAQVVIDEIPHWDGYRHSEAHFEWCGKDQEAATIFATLAHLCGYRTITTQHRREAMGWADVWKVRFTKATTITEKGSNASWVPFTGNVYCPTVDTGYFLCRRKGTIFVTGNSAESSAKVNMQNLPRTSPIKGAIQAPEGFALCGADLSNIELRLGLWLAEQDDRVQMLAQGLDLYKDFAGAVFGVAYDDVTKEQRQVGKVSNLSLIYGTGAAKLREALRIMGGISMAIDKVTPIVQLYRQRNSRVVDAWALGEQALAAIAAGKHMPLFRGGICLVEGARGIRLPSGLYMQFPNLRRQYVEDKRTGNQKAAWVFDSKYGPETVYGSKVFQGVTQAIARCIMADGLRRLERNVAPVVLTIHDSAYWLAPAGAAEASLQQGLAAITHPVAYCPGLPLAAEGGFGKSLADC